MFSIKVEGLDRLQRHLNRNLKPAFRRASLAIAEVIRDEIAKYPPATIANSPSNPRGRWYQRGYGPRWARRDGSVGGRKTSEQLGQSWTTRQKDMGAIVGTKVSYAPFVQAANQQASFHQGRGWVTDRQAVQDVIKQGVVKRIFTKAIMHELRKG